MKRPAAAKRAGASTGLTGGERAVRRKPAGKEEKGEDRRQKALNELGIKLGSDGLEVSRNTFASRWYGRAKKIAVKYGLDEAVFAKEAYSIAAAMWDGAQ
eukprot:5945800-Pyramimonas_sp.AAC.1